MAKRETTMIEPVISADFTKVTFKIDDGGEPIILDMTKLHPNIRARASCAGMAQVRMVDATAISREGERLDENGNKVSYIRDRAEMMRLKRAALQRLKEHYESGTEQWNVRASIRVDAEAELANLRAEVAALKARLGDATESA